MKEMLTAFIVHRSSFVVMPDIDFFDFFRYALAWVVTIYATVITLQSLWGWYVWLAGSDKYISLVRRYVIVHGLRLRFRAFWGDVIISVLLCVAFLILWHAHTIIYRFAADYKSAKQSLTQNVHPRHVSRITQ
jgi:hypothetical protein